MISCWVSALKEYKPILMAYMLDINLKRLPWMELILFSRENYSMRNANFIIGLHLALMPKPIIKAIMLKISIV